MGLLDKVDNLDETKPAKAVAKKAVAKKAVAKKAVAKKAVAKKAVATKSETKVAKSRPEREAPLRPTGLPDGYELSGTMPRYIGWLINFAWNYGILIGTISAFAFGDPDFTIPFAGAALMILINWFVIPIWMGRNIGEFVSRTKYINSSGKKPNVTHAVLNNSLGFLFLFGVIIIFMNFQTISTTNGMTWFAIGAFCILVWIVNFFFKKNSDYSQGLFDLAFSSYLVKHVATGEETGWMARFEGLGDFGDKWQKNKIAREEKAKMKMKSTEKDTESEVDDLDQTKPAKAVAKKAVAAEEESSED
jgi:hypothetical protein